MTQNQINYWALEETKRHNRATESNQIYVANRSYEAAVASASISANAAITASYINASTQMAIAEKSNRTSVQLQSMRNSADALKTYVTTQANRDVVSAQIGSSQKIAVMNVVSNALMNSSKNQTSVQIANISADATRYAANKSFGSNLISSGLRAGSGMLPLLLPQ